MKWIPFLFILGLIGALAVSLRDNRQADRWVVDRDSVLAGVQVREDSVRYFMAMAERLAADAFRTHSAAERLKARGDASLRSALQLRDSLNHLTPPDTCLPYLLIASQAHDSLSVALRSTQAGFDSLTASYGLLERAYQAQLSRAGLLQASVDSLTALVGRVPRPKKWVPVVTVGYGAVLTGGVVRMGPSLSVGFRVPF